MQDLLWIELLGNFHTDGADRLELDAAVVLIAEEPSVLDGDGGLRGEEPEDALVLLREPAPRADVVRNDDPQQVPPVEQRFGQGRGGFDALLDDGVRVR